MAHGGATSDHEKVEHLKANDNSNPSVRMRNLADL